MSVKSTTYKSTSIVIKASQDGLFKYCEEMSKLAKLFKNTMIYRCRQLFFAHQKEYKDLSKQEQEVIDEFNQIGVEFPICEYKSVYLPTYNDFDKMYKKTKNPDYFNDLPMQSTQQIIKEVLQDFKNYKSSFFKYLQDPSKFTGKPKLPGYVKSDKTIFTITNQDAVVKHIENKKTGEIETFLKLPKTKVLVKLGDLEIGKLKEMQIMPYYDTYKIILVEEITDTIAISPKTDRILGLDLGVDNFVAASNNCGLTPFVINGKELKAYNQWYNKTIATLRSSLPQKVYTSKKIQTLNKARAHKTADFYNKTAVYIVRYCVANNIETIVVGKNNQWKTDSNMGKTTNQNFCFIAHTAFVDKLKEIAIRFGIEVIVAEESYTSKASFLDNDFIPTYKKDDKTKYEFSGKRVKRGLYKSKHSIFINADVNGASNIIRKTIPNAFDGIDDLSYLYTTVSRVHICKINTYKNKKSNAKIKQTNYVMENKKNHIKCKTVKGVVATWIGLKDWMACRVWALH